MMKVETAQHSTHGLADAGGSPAWRRRSPLAAALASAFLLAGSADALALHRCPHHYPAPLSGDTVG